MTQPVGLDTSIAVPLLMQAHPDHRLIAEWWAGRAVALCGHALIETYSVLTRLPGDLNVEPADAARLLDERFAPPLILAAKTVRRLPSAFARMGVSGGQVYDALVGLAAVEHEVALATRDGRARVTYEAVGARVIVVG